MNKELGDFLREQCKERGLSLRSLSIHSGLSPATVHNIVKREYMPTLYSLNRLADYLSIRRQYLWWLAGLLEDEDYNSNGEFDNPQLNFQFARVDKLPKPAKNLAINVIGTLISYLEICENGLIRTSEYKGETR